MIRARGAQIVTPHHQTAAVLNADLQEGQVASAPGREQTVIGVEVVDPLLHRPVGAGDEGVEQGVAGTDHGSSLDR